MTRVAAALLFAVASACGSSAPSDESPAAEVTITVRWDGASVEEIETGLANPLELAASQVAGIAGIRSVSSEGRVVVTVVPASSTNVEVLAQAIRAAVSAIGSQLPIGAGLPVVSRISHRGREARVVYKPPDTATRVDARAGFDNLLDKLQQVPGVSVLHTCGEAEPEYRVLLSLPELAALRLPIERIVRAINDAAPSTPEALGAIELGDQVPIHLKDVAMIELQSPVACTPETTAGQGLVATIAIDGNDPEATWKQLQSRIAGTGAVTLVARRTLTAAIELPAGESMDAMLRLTRHLEQVASVPGVRWLAMETTADLTRATIAVDQVEHTTAVARALDAGVADIPGLGAVRLVGDGVAAREAVLRGPDLAQLRSQANAAVDQLRRDPAITAAGCAPCRDVPHLDLKIDRDHAARYEIAPNAIATVIQVASPAGIPTTALIPLDEWSRRPVPVRVSLAEQVRPEDLDRLLVAGSTSAVPLSQLVNLTQTASPTAIRHENRERVIIVWASGASVAAVEHALHAAAPGATLRPSRSLDP